ncbi:hypothetical protein AB6C49_19560, partial [Vibrio cyclitrophicus]
SGLENRLTEMSNFTGSLQLRAFCFFNFQFFLFFRLQILSNKGLKELKNAETSAPLPFTLIGDQTTNTCKLQLQNAISNSKKANKTLKYAPNCYKTTVSCCFKSWHTTCNVYIDPS